jgi:hypothetical protein
MPTSEQNLWVARVLGVTLSSPANTDFDQDGSFAKARQAWIAARRKTDAAVSALQDAVVDAYASRGLGPKLAAAYQKEVARVLTALDERVAAALDALVANRNDGRRAMLLGDAAEAIEDYQAFLGTDPIIDGLDKNPFGVALSIRATLSSTLSTLGKALA